MVESRVLLLNFWGVYWRASAPLMTIKKSHSLQVLNTNSTLGRQTSGGLRVTVQASNRINSSFGEDTGRRQNHILLSL
jgi:hypothetical protein